MAVTNFVPGQCWMSETEPELGVGFVVEHDQQSVTVDYPASEQTRRYGKRSAPLKRLVFREGDTVESFEGDRFVVSRVEEHEGLVWYFGPENKELCESDLSAKLKLQRPLERLLAGKWDPLTVYELRRETLEHSRRMLSAPSRGFIGPRAQLLPHQLYVVHQIASRGLPRALLADEVGLGKTIEAGWVLHHLVVTGRARRVLIVVPKSLINQWFIELLRRFNLSFWVPESQSEEGVAPSDFAMKERVILSLESFAVEGLSAALERAGWDLIVVDEAHRVEWAPEKSSATYSALERLAARTRGLLLLTATPEQLGLEGHFARLRLIDPMRFSSWTEFQKEHNRYRSVARLAEALLSEKKLAKKDLGDLVEKLEGKMDAKLLDDLETPQARQAALRALVDHFGTGRIYFRNSRQVVEREHCFFPKRILMPHKLKKSQQQDDAFASWLGEFARAHRDEKTLLICASGARAIELERRMKEDFGLKAVGFHEGMPLLVRDRNAAYFEEPDGASILLCSEIGGEGRNFQHARHLVLADLPEDPDVLEQRIGRLDRIGQSSDIQIHVPYVVGDRTELLLRWHREVFEAFSAPAKGGGLVYDRLKAQLHAVLASGEEKQIDGFFVEAADQYAKTLKKIEEGRDRLIEINSFDADEGAALARSLAQAEKPDLLRKYLEGLFDAFGLHTEDLDATSLFVEAGDSAFASYFPALPDEGLRITFSREKALLRDDLTLMSWDHPMVTDTVDAIGRNEAGNVSVATWDPGEARKPEFRSLLLFECFFAFEPVSEPEWFADEFLPSQPLRVVLDATGKDLSARFSQETLRKLIVQLPNARAGMVTKLPPEALRGVLEKANASAEKMASRLRAEAMAAMKRRIEAELQRLETLRARNNLVSERETKWWQARRERLEAAFENARVRMDSFLMVLPG